MKPNSIKILHIDSNHSLLWDELQAAGFQNEADFTSSKETIEAKIANYHGIVIRSRFKIDKNFIDKATNFQRKSNFFTCQSVIFFSSILLLSIQIDLFNKCFLLCLNHLL